MADGEPAGSPLPQGEMTERGRPAAAACRAQRHLPAVSPLYADIAMPYIQKRCELPAKISAGHKELEASRVSLRAARTGAVRVVCAGAADAAPLSAAWHRRNVPAGAAGMQQGAPPLGAQLLIGDDITHFLSLQALLQKLVEQLSALFSPEAQTLEQQRPLLEAAAVSWPMGGRAGGCPARPRPPTPALACLLCVLGAGRFLVDCRARRTNPPHTPPSPTPTPTPRCWARLCRQPSASCAR